MHYRLRLMLWIKYSTLRHVVVGVHLCRLSDRSFTKKADLRVVSLLLK